MDSERGSFSGKIGFVLAAAGSAVGLGNIWRFPYLTAKYGGGIFILTYIVLAATLGFALMTAEISLGRRTGQSAVHAYSVLNKKCGAIGWINCLVPAIITPYYCVIGGWVIKYLTDYVSGNGVKAAEDGYFNAYISANGSPLLFFAVFMALTALVTLFGVEEGVERVSKYMMPVLVVLSIIIAIYSMCQDGAMEGIKYLFKPNFADFSFKTVLAAMTQMFYSLSLAMGIMITYGSYMKKDVDIQSSVFQIEIFDSGIAVLAAMMIIPAVFSFSTPDQLNAGPGLMFVTLPKLFAAMPGGRYVGILFFLLVLLAALTSSISLMETLVSIVKDKFRLSRKVTCIMVFVFCIVLGTLSVLGYGAWDHITVFGMQFLDFFDYLSNTIMMPIAAFLTCIFVGFIVKPAFFVEEVRSSSRFSLEKLFVVMIKYIAPICIVVILLGSLFVTL